MACRHLDEQLRCRLFGHSERPACCRGLQAAPEMCGESREQALAWLAALEAATAVAQDSPMMVNTL